MTKSLVRRTLWSDKLHSGLVLSSSDIRCQAVPSTPRRQSPSVESWNYFLRRLSCNVENLTPSAPFRYLIPATNLWQGATDPISLGVLKAWVATNHIKRVMIFAHQNTCAAFNFVLWIALNKKSCIRARTISIFAEIEHQLLPKPTE